MKPKPIGEDCALVTCPLTHQTPPPSPPSASMSHPHHPSDTPQGIGVPPPSPICHSLLFSLPHLSAHSHCIGPISLTPDTFHCVGVLPPSPVRHPGPPSPALCTLVFHLPPFSPIIHTPHGSHKSLKQACCVQSGCGKRCCLCLTPTNPQSTAGS